MNSTDRQGTPSNNTAVGSLLSSGTKIGLVSAYVSIFVIALFGNSIGIYVVSAKAPSRRISNLLIKNLAIADLIFALTVLPHTVLYIHFEDNRWIGGTVGTVTCKVFFYIIPVSIAASVITLTVISVDRFCAIYFPLNQGVFHKHKTKTAIIWLTSLLIMSPHLLLFQVSKSSRGDLNICSPKWPWAKDLMETFLALRVFHIVGFILLYALPLLIIVVANCFVARRLWFYKSNEISAEVRTRRKVVKMLIIIVVVFALCWLPSYVNHYFMYFQTDDWHKIPIEVRLLMFWVSHANSAVNPILYIAFNKNFRYEFVDATFALFTSPVRATRACLAYISEEQSTSTPDSRGQTEQPAWLQTRRTEDFLDTKF